MRNLWKGGNPCSSSLYHWVGNVIPNKYPKQPGFCFRCSFVLLSSDWVSFLKKSSIPQFWLKHWASIAKTTSWKTWIYLLNSDASYGTTQQVTTNTFDKKQSYTSENWHRTWKTDPRKGDSFWQHLVSGFMKVFKDGRICQSKNLQPQNLT